MRPGFLFFGFPEKRPSYGFASTIRVTRKVKGIGRTEAMIGATVSGRLNHCTDKKMAPVLMAILTIEVKGNCKNFLKVGFVL
jgi:hypothetical protein